MPTPLTQSEIDRWHQVLAAAAQVQTVIPEAILAGGTAVGIYTPYRTSHDADHYIPDFPRVFDSVQERLTTIVGWITEEVRGQHTILGHLDGTEVSFQHDDRVRGLGGPLEIQHYSLRGMSLCLPTLFELLRIKSYLLMFRNHARDYADCVALAKELKNPVLFSALVLAEQRYPMRPHPAWSHDGSQKPLSFLYEMGLRLVSPLPRDLKKTLNHWDQRFRLVRPEELPSWTTLVSKCQELGERVLEVHQVLTDPEADPELAARYGVLYPKGSEPRQRDEGESRPP